MYSFAWRGEVYSKKDGKRYSFYVTANSEEYARSQVQSMYGSEAKSCGWRRRREPGSYHCASDTLRLVSS